MNISIHNLIEFVVEAKKSTYAAGDSAEKIMLENGGIQMDYSSENLHYQDLYYGGEPFFGEEIVLFNNNARWVMNYMGRSSAPSHINLKDLYEFLRESLLQVNQHYPFRGPDYYQKRDYIYRMKYTGGFEFFSGTEEVLVDDQSIYSGYFHGGLVIDR